MVDKREPRVEVVLEVERISSAARVCASICIDDERAWWEGEVRVRDENRVEVVGERRRVRR